MADQQEINPKILNVIAERWSPRSFDQSEIPQEDLDTILEAAGWAPSGYNLQPWTFLYSRRGDENWERYLSLLSDFNRSWAQNSSALVFVISDRMLRMGDGEPTESYNHSFDAGAAWALAALQATALGYHTHAMTGLQFDKALAELNIPADHRLEAAFVIGPKGPVESLPEGLQAREVKSGRKPLAEIARTGNFA